MTISARQDAPSSKQGHTAPTYQEFHTATQIEAGQSISRSFRLDVYACDPLRSSAQTVSDAVLVTFLGVCNGAFAGRQHERNFGPAKLRYPTTDAFRQDLEHGHGGWVFLLHEKLAEQHDHRQEIWAPAACAKVTKDGTGMDGGVGIHDVVVRPDSPGYEEAPPKKVYWLGALGSARPGAGSVLLTNINRFLSATVPDGTFLLRAYSVHSWGIGEDWALPESSPLLDWFVKQGFVIYGYSWKPPGTWGCFYGACLGDLRYTHNTQTLAQ